MKVRVLSGLLLAPLAIAAGGEAPRPPPAAKEALYVSVYDEAEPALARLKTLADASDWPAAVQAAQQYIEAAGDALVAIRPGLYVPFVEQVQRQVCAWPEAGIRAYRAKYEPAADRLYREALDKRDPAGLARVTRFYPATATARRAAVALADIHAQSGQLRRAKRLLDRLIVLPQSGGPTPKQLAVRRDALATALDRRHDEPGVAGDWAALGGGPMRRGLAGSAFRIGLARWTLDVPQADVDRARAVGLRTRVLRVPRLMHPAVAGPRIFVQTTQWVAALDRDSGDILWRYPREPAAVGPLNLRDAVLAPCAWRGRVFAVVAGQVVALVAATGDCAWSTACLADRRPGPEEPDGDKRAAAPRTLVNSVLAADGKVFACAAAIKQETESVVLALDAATGATLWRRTLCSQVFRGYLGRGSHPAPPAFAEGTLYVSTNLGALAALDAETGSVRWLARYPAFVPARRRVALRTDACWENGPPLVTGGLLLAAPQDADHLVAFDVETGRPVWRAPRLDARYLAGVAGGRAFLVGSTAAAVDLKTGKVVWFAPIGAPPAGRPALTAAALLVPTREALIRIDIASGKIVSRYRLDGPRQAGNLVLAGRTLLVSGFDRLAAYGDAAHLADSDKPADQLARGVRLDRLGDLAGALKAYTRALYALDEEPAAVTAKLRGEVLEAISGAQMRQGRQLLAAGRSEDAERALLLARRYAPLSRQSVDATFAIAACRERRGKWTAAIAAYQFAIQRQRGGRIERHGVFLPAETVARASIDRVIAAQGRAVYAEQERKAAGLLDGARKANAPRLLERLLLDYPNSAHAPAARRELGRSVGARKAETPALVWRTGLDTARASPVIVPEGAALPGGSEPVFALVTRDRGDPGTFLWDAVECRRVRDGGLVWRTGLRQSLSKGAVVDGRLVLQGADHFSAIDVKTGKMAWSTQARPGTGLDKMPGLGRLLGGKRIVDAAHGGGKVFAATAAGGLFAVDSTTGKEVWRRRLDTSVVRGSMQFGAGRLVLCTESPGTVHWIDPVNGKDARSLRLQRADNRLTDAPAFQPKAGRLCLVLGDRQVRNLRLDTGKTLWTAEMDFSIGRVAVSADERHVVVFPDRWSFGGKATCFDAARGRRLWGAAPQAKSPDSAYLGRDLLISVRRGTFSDVLVAQRLSNGSVAWRRPLTVRPGVETLVGAGDALIAYGSGLGAAGWSGAAVLVRKSDGALLATLSRPGAGYSAAGRVADTFVLCSDRGIEAYRVGGAAESAGKLAAVLAADQLPRDEAGLSELARLLLVGRHYETAMSVLDRALMAERPKPETFGRLHARLAAVRQAAVEQHRITYAAPRFPHPPRIDGRMAEDWRRDRAAVLDRPRSIEPMQSRLPPQRFWFGPNDLSATLYLGWDDQNLYLAVDVNDDVQTTHEFDAPLWKGDCLMVSIDPEHDGGYRLGGADHLFWLALTAKQRKPPEDDDERLGGEHSIKIKEDETGAVYELALPWKDVGVAQPAPGTRFGLNIMVVDDDGRPPVKGASWTPGLTQNVKRDIMSAGIAPALYGTVILKER